MSCRWTFVRCKSKTSREPVAERQALLELYDATGGEEWIDRAGWLGASGTECTWHGVTCDQGGTIVMALELKENNLDGPLPDEIGLLDGLVELDLSRNRLGGTVPSSIGALGELERLISRTTRFELPDLHRSACSDRRICAADAGCEPLPHIPSDTRADRAMTRVLDDSVHRARGEPARMINR